MRRSAGWSSLRLRARESAVLLARAVGGGQEARIGDQTGGRIGWFLNTGAFDRDYERMRTAGVAFEEEPRHEPNGTVCRFRDLYGNRWDLIQLRSDSISRRSGRRSPSVRPGWGAASCKPGMPRAAAARGTRVE